MFRLSARNKHNNKRNSACRQSGFTLVELLIYMAVFGIAVGMLSSILVTFTRVQSRESASAEVTQQLSFVQTTIQRLVRESVNIENQLGVGSPVLTLRMASPALDPTVISSDADAIYLKQGSGAVNPLTSSQVKVAGFQITKYENPGGHAIVQLDFSLSYNSQRVYQQITRGLKTSIGRVTAATFDDNLLPGAPNLFAVGNATYPWKSLTLSGQLDLGQLTADPVAGARNGSLYYNSVDNAFRGYKNGAWSDLGGAGWAVSAADIYNTNTGNVGIGTAAPSEILQIVKLQDADTTVEIKNNQASAAAGAVLRLHSEAGGFDPRVFFQVGGGGLDWRVGVDNSDSDKFKIAGGVDDYSSDVGVNTRVTINNSGNVGIGTEEPSEKLEVFGPGNLAASSPTGYRILATIRQQSGGGTGAVRFGGNSASVGIISSYAPGYDLAFYTGDTEFKDRLHILNNGNIGIGTTNPTELLEILTTATPAKHLLMAKGSNTLAPATLTQFDFNLQNDRTGLGLGANNTINYLWVSDAGNLHINAYAPTAHDQGVVVGTQTSLREHKQDITDYTNYNEALNLVLNAPLHKFRYKKEVQGYGEDNPLAKYRIGFIADEADPQFMWGNAIDQVSVNGILMAATRELDQRTRGLGISEQGDVVIKQNSVGIGTTNPGSYKLDVVGGKFRAAANTYDSGWFAIADNTAYTKIHNLGTSKILINLYGATDASGSNMNSLGDVREYGGGFNGVTVSNIGLNSVDVRTASNTTAPQTRIWNGSAWVYPAYARIVILALE